MCPEGMLSMWLQSVASSGKQWQAVAISGNQWQSVAISGNQWHLDVPRTIGVDVIAIIGNQ
jgi:hypothetical protein